MAGSILVASLAVVGLLLAFFFWKLGDEHNDGRRYPLQIIVFAFLLGVIVLLGKVSVDYEDHCSWLVSNSTVSGSTTSYNYTYTCEDNTNSTATIFYQITVWIARLTAAYLFFMFAFELIKHFGMIRKGMK